MISGAKRVTTPPTIYTPARTLTIHFGHIAPPSRLTYPTILISEPAPPWLAASRQTHRRRHLPRRKPGPAARRSRSGRTRGPKVVSTTLPPTPIPTPPAGGGRPQARRRRAPWRRIPPCRPSRDLSPRGR